MDQNHTNCGKSFSAALRGTENPPCVLVSLAVKVLQKNSVGCLLAFSPKSGIGKTSFSCNKENIHHYIDFCHIILKFSYNTSREIIFSGQAYRIYTLQTHLGIDLITFFVCLLIRRELKQCNVSHSLQILVSQKSSLDKYLHGVWHCELGTTTERGDLDSLVFVLSLTY